MTCIVTSTVIQTGFNKIIAVSGCKDLSTRFLVSIRLRGMRMDIKIHIRTSKD